jgi:hypothetical protein
MIALILFTACQLGLRQGNPNQFNSEIQEDIPSIEKEEQLSEHPIYVPSLDYDFVVSGPTLSQDSSPENPIVDTTPNVIFDGTLYNPVESIYGSPNSDDETTQEIEESETTIEETTEGEDCFVEIELICGPDGWLDRLLLIQIDDEEESIWASVCEQEEQSWDYYLSEIYTYTLSSAEDLEISLCDTEDNCNNLTQEDLGIRIISNDIELEHVYTPSSNWSFSYSCP